MRYEQQIHMNDSMRTEVHSMSSAKNGILIMATLLCFSSVDYARAADSSVAEPLNLHQQVAMSIEERIFARTDPDRISQRLREARNAGSLGHDSDPHDLIDGNRHPELLLPTEVFRRLIRVTLQSPPEVAEIHRDVYGHGIVREELPDDFWYQLGAIAAQYVRVSDEWENIWGSNLSEMEARASLRRLRVERCAALREALSAAIETFEEERLMRFLYGSVAPRMFIATTTPVSAQTLRWREGGCR
jgi:hypothetical protein